jgi:hypothetical protein
MASRSHEWRSRSNCSRFRPLVITKLMLLPGTRVRRHYVISAVKLFVLAAAILLLPVLCEVDTVGLALIFVLSILSAVLGWVNLRHARQTPEDAVEPSILEEPVPIQLWYCRRALWVIAASFTILTAFMVYDINRLDDGGGVLWQPSAILYQLLGFWPAVLVVPIPGILFCVALMYRIRKLRSKA